MSTERSRVEVKPGQVVGVHVWPMPNFPDIRGSLSKAYVAGEFGSFPVSFQMLEHFFTRSKKNVFRGMHFQGAPHRVSKIVSIIQGRATDFLLDMRVDSVTYGHLQIQEMNSENPISIYVPVGVAHGYIALEDKTIISYKMDGFFCANCDGGISGEVVKKYLPIDYAATIRSKKDQNLQGFDNFEYKSSCSE